MLHTCGLVRWNVCSICFHDGRKLRSRRGELIGAAKCSSPSDVVRSWFDLIRFDSFSIIFIGFVFKKKTFEWKHTGTDPIYTCASHDIGHVCALLECHTYFPLAIFYILFDRWGRPAKRCPGQGENVNDFSQFFFLWGFSVHSRNTKIENACDTVASWTRSPGTIDTLRIDTFEKWLISITPEDPLGKKKIILHWIQSICVVV